MFETGVAEFVISIFVSWAVSLLCTLTRLNWFDHFEQINTDYDSFWTNRHRLIPEVLVQIPASPLCNSRKINVPRVLSCPNYPTAPQRAKKNGFISMRKWSPKNKKSQALDVSLHSYHKVHKIRHSPNCRLTYLPVEILSFYRFSRTFCCRAFFMPIDFPVELFLCSMI